MIILNRVWKYGAIHVVVDTDQWWALVEAVMNVYLHKEAE
jgi:fructose/tagatose bisphosphate aldolase